VDPYEDSSHGGDSMICLLPGASATGRDFLLEKLLAHTDVIGSRLSFDRPLRIIIAKKTTTRPSRGVDLLKNCVSREDFESGRTRGEIIAPYILESNSELYGYHIDAFQQSDADMLIADASVYQMSELASRFGDRVYSASMIATRAYRETNLRTRGSEKEEEITDRLNLGDAHVAIAIMMSRKSGLSYRDFIDPTLADLFDSLITHAEADEKSVRTSQLIADFTKSKNVTAIVQNLARSDAPCIDELIVLTDLHRIAGETDITSTAFFDLGVSILKNALKKPVVYA